jgi:hypothetical protein
MISDINLSLSLETDVSSVLLIFDDLNDLLNENRHLNSLWPLITCANSDNVSKSLRVN